MSADLKKPFVSGLVEGCIDINVYQDILKTYAKETISFLDFGNLGITTINPTKINRVEFTECEISPFRKYEIDCATDEENKLARKPSMQRFSQRIMPFANIQKLLIHSFSPNETNTRPYPSAGGLYPVEPLVFLFKERMDGFDYDSGCYHFRPISKKLQLIKKIPTTQFFTQLLHNYLAPPHLPSFGILYMAHIGKAIFKYRYRGYRHALMEAGSMYQQAAQVAEQQGLRHTVWCTFSEHELLYALELDYGTYMPLAMQFFGYEEAKP